jgi:hypothetical protein
MHMRRWSVVAVAATGVVALATACETETTTLGRSSDPVVLTGADLPQLAGTDPDLIVAFRHAVVDGEPTWSQVPVQVDERKVVDYGAHPASNATPGEEGTVYGGAPIGVADLQYADPGTFVGPDADPTFDADDELVVMAYDLGGAPGEDHAAEPPGVVPGSGVAVEVADPDDPAKVGRIHLFVTDGSLAPDAGRDDVVYDFALASGDYRSTYRRADGPNPETSTVRTDVYTVGFSDRWHEDTWRVHAGGATGVDVLDGNKNQFALSTCGRSNATFADAEGAFVANVDGPLRAIRSYVGANSGPLTQRTHLLYRDREEIITDLRVHSIPAVMDYLDLSAEALGATYRSSTVPGGVLVDGVLDPVGATVPTWESFDGPQGTILTAVELTTDVPGLDDAVQWFQRDQATPPETQCWGDSSLYGAAGSNITGGIPNTDPRSTPSADLRVRRVVQFQGPATDPTLLPAAAATWSTQVRDGLDVSAAPHPAP